MLGVNGGHSMWDAAIYARIFAYNLYIPRLQGFSTSTQHMLYTSYKAWEYWEDLWFITHIPGYKEQNKGWFLSTLYTTLRPMVYWSISVRKNVYESTFM